MPDSTNKPPSRVRYEGSHPVVSARLSKQDRDVLDSIIHSRGISFADFVREAIGRANPVYDKVYQSGIQEGRRLWGIKVPCFWDDLELDVTPGSAAHIEIIKYAREHGWGHEECLQFFE